MNWLIGGFIGLIAGAIRGAIGFWKKEDEQFDEIRFAKTVLLSMIFGMIAGTSNTIEYTSVYAIAGETIVSDLAEILNNKRF